jgi:hypothetical protein
MVKYFLQCALCPDAFGNCSSELGTSMLILYYSSYQLHANNGGEHVILTWTTTPVHASLISLYLVFLEILAL